MEGTRTQKSLRNASCSALAQMVSIVTRFVVRTVFVRELGAAFVGLDALMAQTVSVLSVAELGLGAAVTFGLYGPLSRGEKQEVAGLVGLLHRAYCLVGLALLGVGLCALPLVPRLVTGVAFSAAYIRAAFALSVLEMAAPYFFSSRRALLLADQRGYIVAMTGMGFQLLSCAVCPAVLHATGRYLPFLLARMALGLCEQAVLFGIAGRRYPHVRAAHLPVEPALRSRVLCNLRHLTVGLLSGKITASADGILISAMVSTVSAGMYSNYALVLRAATGLFGGIASSLAGALGSLYASGDRGRAERAFGELEFAFGAAGMVTAAVAYCALTPFVRLWLGDGYALGDGALFVCAFNAGLLVAREPLWRMATASGLFVWDKRVSVAGSAVNLAVSVVLGRVMGLTGILLGTTCTLVLQIELKTVLLYGRNLHMTSGRALWRWNLRMALTLLAMTLARMAADALPEGPPALGVIARGCVAVAVCVSVLCAGFGRTPEFARCVALLHGMIRIPVGKKRGS